jgi:hypothetical protein
MIKKIYIDSYYTESWYWCFILLGYVSSTSRSCYRIFNRMTKVQNGTQQDHRLHSLHYCPSNLLLSVTFVPLIVVSYDVKADHVIINILCMFYAS